MEAFLSLDKMLSVPGIDPSILLRLFVAVILGGLIGWERGGNNHEAGLRTHIIVALGAATIAVISECLAARYNGQEVMRLSAQVISGVGFLGAGSIIMDGNRIKGITTAAGIWTTACVGLAIGAGYYIISILVTALVLFTMLGLRSMTKKLQRKSMHYTICCETPEKAALMDIIDVLEAEGIQARSIKNKFNSRARPDVDFFRIDPAAGRNHRPAAVPNRRH